MITLQVLRNWWQGKNSLRLASYRRIRQLANASEDVKLQVNQVIGSLYDLLLQHENTPLFLIDGEKTYRDHLKKLAVASDQEFLITLKNQVEYYESRWIIGRWISRQNDPLIIHKESFYEYLKAYLITVTFYVYQEVNEKQTIFLNERENLSINPNSLKDWQNYHEDVENVFKTVNIKLEDLTKIAILPFEEAHENSNYSEEYVLLKISLLLEIFIQIKEKIKGINLTNATVDGFNELWKNEKEKIEAQEFDAELFFKKKEEYISQLEKIAEKMHGAVTIAEDQRFATLVDNTKKQTLELLTQSMAETKQSLVGAIFKDAHDQIVSKRVACFSEEIDLKYETFSGFSSNKESQIKEMKRFLDEQKEIFSQQINPNKGSNRFKFKSTNLVVKPSSSLASDKIEKENVSNSNEKNHSELLMEDFEPIIESTLPKEDTSGVSYGSSHEVVLDRLNNNLIKEKNPTVELKPPPLVSELMGELKNIYRNALKELSHFSKTDIEKFNALKEVRANELRVFWKKHVLRLHPDKNPDEVEQYTEYAAQWTVLYKSLYKSLLKQVIENINDITFKNNYKKSPNFNYYPRNEAELEALDKQIQELGEDIKKLWERINKVEATMEETDQLLDALLNFVPQHKS